MFKTVKELHIAVDVGLQHVSSNRKQSIPPEIVDMALNMANLSRIDSIIDDRRNNRREGFEENQINYDSLQTLKTSITLPLYKLNDIKSFAILPANYKYHSSSEVSYYYNRNGVSLQQNEYIKYLTRIPINIGEPDQEGLYLTNLLIWREINNSGNRVGIYSYKDTIKIWDKDGLFMLIHDILSSLALNEIEAYWEYYNNSYYPNQLILVTSYEITSSGSIENEVSGITEELVYTKPDFQELILKTSPTDLIKSIELSNIRSNYYYSKNRHKKPLLEIEGNKLIVYHNDTFDVDSITMTYIKTPRLININTNTMCEGNVTEKIVALAIQTLKAYIKDEGYNLILNENKQN